MRNSDWQIIWDPETTPLVLLDYDDVMDAEIRLGGQQLAGSGVSDFALRTVALSRQNRKIRLEITRRLPHATTGAAWLACVNALIASPWGRKTMDLRITPRGGAARGYAAALLDSTHKPAHADGLIESVHSYSLRIVPL